MVLLPPPILTLLIRKVKVGPPGRRISFYKEKGRLESRRSAREQGVGTSPLSLQSVYFEARIMATQEAYGFIMRVGGGTGQGDEGLRVLTHEVDVGLRFTQNQEVCDPKGPSHCHTILQSVFLSYLKITKTKWNHHKYLF